MGFFSHRNGVAAMESQEKRADAYTLPPGKALVLRTCAADMTSHGGFVWPTSGPVMCDDWSTRAACGNGLHGLLWGAGDGALLDWSSTAVWMAVEIDPETAVDLNGKVKFPRGVVVMSGARDAVVSLMQAFAPAGTAIVGGTATAGDAGTATAGYGGTATAGDGGTATAGVGGTATAGDAGTATAGDGGTATAGDGGTATAGYGGTATAGVGGTATAGDGGTARSGEGGIVSVEWWDLDAKRWRIAIGYVGEDGIAPNTLYRAVDGKLVTAE